MRNRRAVRIMRRLWLTAGVVFLVWLFISFQARGVDPAVLHSNGRVTVIPTDDAFVFHPTHVSSRTGLVLLPGAMVDPVAYTPVARALAERGFTTALVKLPFRVAATEAQRQQVVARIQAVISANTHTEQWVLAGHSRGGALAARFAHQHTLDIAGLILIATTHPKAAPYDLSGSDLDVTNIYATRDGLASEAEMRTTAVYLPASTQWVRIEGGNHAQFGWYGAQLGDSSATISRVKQQALLIDAIAAALLAVEQRPPSQ